ncbi:prephenate dehydratase [Gordonia desulfuricans]|uniref:Prephenate dehydratase n=1 Tax=Gordonia desulfuricans TaxID=89051 RepID=A0A7K3LWW6_9ACTN|nr:prephenate dehydratase [Gordonia desulfuricans]NDK92047.1 prephenate dehydratase [Gordonia desulfuricans]
MTVFAYFGPPGTFTEMALDRLLADPHLSTGVRSDGGLGGVGGGTVDKLVAASPVATIAAVRSGAADFGCVPIESSLEGSVPATMDALVPFGDGAAASEAGRVQIFAEVNLDIAFTIAARPGTAPADVRTIAAYPVASAQVREAVEKLYPGAEFVTAGSNAAAAHDVAEGRTDAAVTTGLAAELAGLEVLADGVSDASDAVTRFLLVGKPAPPPRRTGTDRTAVMLELRNQPGSLMEAMNEFAVRGVDLTRIESRPRRDPAGGSTHAGQYRFFLDTVGHIDDAPVAEAVRALHHRCERIVYLGSWPAAGDGGSPPPDDADSAAWVEAIRRGEG